MDPTTLRDTANARNNNVDKKVIKEANHIRKDVDKMIDKNKLMKKAEDGKYSTNLYKFKKEKDCDLLKSSTELVGDYRGFSFDFREKGKKCWLDVNWKVDN